MKNILLILICLSSYSLVAQSQEKASYQLTAKQEATYLKWATSLYEMGVKLQGDSIVLNAEAKRILADTNYYKLIYPETYRWRDTQILMKRMVLKPAFWYMINLLDADPNNKELVLKMILPFDQIFEMDKVLLGTLYTYVRFDPMVTSVINGEAQEVNRPDIAEQKMLATKEIVDHILAQRANRQKTKG